MEQKKTGQVEINFREGQIRNYTVRESFLVEKEKINNANALDSYSRKQ